MNNSYFSPQTHEMTTFEQSKLMRFVNFQYMIIWKFWTIVFPSGLCHDWYDNCFNEIQSLEDTRIYVSYFFWSVIATLSTKNMLFLSLVFSSMVFLPGTNMLQNLYMPTLGVTILIAQGYHYLLNHAPRFAKITCVLVLIGLTMGSIQRSFDWQSDESLYKSCLRQG